MSKPRLTRPSSASADAALLLAGAQPRYASVATALAAEILEGGRPISSLLPSEQELCLRFGVSRSTVRQALRRLGELGLVASAQGVGTRVIADQPRSQYLLAVRSATEVMGYATRTRLDIRHRERVVADAVLARRIGCTPGSAWLHVAGLRREAERDTPVSLCDLYVADEFAAVADSSELATVPAYRLIGRKLGIGVAGVKQDISAIAL